MDEIKAYLIEVVGKKMLPSLIKGSIAALLGLLLAHQGVLDAIGVSYDAPGRTIDINLDKFTVWLVTGGTGVLMAIFTALQHHTVATIKGEPQSGDPKLEARRSTDQKEIK